MKIISNKECLDSFFELSKMEGIIPALENAHAVAFAIDLAQKLSKNETILVNLSGKDDKDIEFVKENYL